MQAGELTARKPVRDNPEQGRRVKGGGERERQGESPGGLNLLTKEGASQKTLPPLLTPYCPLPSPPRRSGLCTDGAWADGGGADPGPP